MLANDVIHLSRIFPNLKRSLPSIIVGKFVEFPFFENKMATYLRSGRFLRTVYSHEKFIKMLSSLPWNAFHEMPLETRLVKRLNDLGITALTEIQQKVLSQSKSQNILFLLNFVTNPCLLI